ncbi:phage terminase large subunit [Methylocaldum sp.]|uniref:phage terminase large subunit n=1 Tax=Methylocaldum sp. TaxID=1969727 RepID=UPI00321F869E
MGEINANFVYSEAQHHIFHESQALGRFRFFPKGRRLGATRGASFAFIEWLLEGKQCLWVDTVNGNIDRYLDRYFLPAIKGAGLDYYWNSQKRLLKVSNTKGILDFRSADRPENIEGFGYHVIFLNEAGIILDDPYLYQNAVLPMLIDFPDSQLIAAGTPKLLHGRGRLFYELCQKAERGEPGYYMRRFSTYDNPFLDPDQIKALAAEIPPNERGQEIGGQFIEEGGNLVQLWWFRRYRAAPTDFVRIVQSWDTGNKPKEMNCPSVCTTWMETLSARYLLDVFRGWLKYPDLKRTTISLADKWSPAAVLIEDKGSGQSLIQELQDTTSLPVIPIEPHGDKIARMNAETTQIEAGNVFLPDHAPWLPEYETEITSFPNGTYSDQVDSTSQALKWMREQSARFQIITSGERRASTEAYNNG